MSNPYAEAAPGYLRLGHSPILLPHKRKSPPPTGYTGYSGAYVTADDVERWAEKGGNVGLRLPETVIGIDVDCYDGKKGAETIAEAEARLGALPDSPVITSRDDGSGIRLFGVEAGRCWADVVGPGVEIIHHGHRFAVAPPSVHPEGRVYGGTVLPVDALPELPDAWVTDLVRGNAADRPVKVETDVEAWLDALPEGEPTDYLRRVLAEADDAYLLGGSRHGVAAKATGALIRAGERGEPGVATALGICKETWLAAMDGDRAGLVEGEWARMVSGAVGLVLGSPTQGPEQDFPVIPGPTPPPPVNSGTGGTPPLAVRLRQRVEAHYDVFPAGDDGRIFVQPKKGGRAELLTGGFVIRASQGAGTQAGTLSAAATEAAKVLTAHAEVKPPRPLALRVHPAPDRIVLDLAQRGNSRCVVVTGDGWTVEDVPPADVLFQWPGKPLPDPEPGGDVDELRLLLRWAEDDPRWALIKGWLPCALLADVPRPLLGFFGPQGSAKSTTGRFVVGVLDPKPSGALGSGFGKNRSDDETKAFASYLVAWDNVSKVSNEGADLLSRLVTGDMIEKRRLYTDAEVATIVYRRTGVLTGVSLPRGVKADTLDRLILITLQPLVERASERALEAEWAKARPRVLAGVLDLAVRMLAGERANPDRLRMADYAEALWAIDPDLYRAYAANVREARAEMASEDPFIATLLAWLGEEPGQEWEGTATEALHAAEWHHEDRGWWPSNGKTFMDTVTASLELLQEVGVTVTERKVKGVRLKQFSLDRLL